MSFAPLGSFVLGTGPDGLGEIVIPPEPSSGGGGGPGYYGASVGRQRYEEEERRRHRQLVETIDRAVARVTGRDDPPPAETETLAMVEGPTGDPLAAIEARMATIDALGHSIGALDAELEALRLQAITMIREIELDDDDEALELLLAA